jgi:hypothetical protein
VKKEIRKNKITVNKRKIGMETRIAREIEKVSEDERLGKK